MSRAQYLELRTIRAREKDNLAIQLIRDAPEGLTRRKIVELTGWTVTYANTIIDRLRRTGLVRISCVGPKGRWTWIEDGLTPEEIARMQRRLELRVKSKRKTPTRPLDYEERRAAHIAALDEWAEAWMARACCVAWRPAAGLPAPKTTAPRSVWDLASQSV